MLHRCFLDTMDCRPVQWVYVLDSGQRSSVTVKPYHPDCLTVDRVASVRRRTTMKGGSNPPGNTCRCLRSLGENTPVVHIIYASVARKGRETYRETRNTYIGGINKAPYCVNYDRAACRHSCQCDLKLRLQATIEAR